MANAALSFVVAAWTLAAGRASAQAPAGAPALPGSSPLGNSLLTPDLASQVAASPEFGALACQAALTNVYDQYTFTGNWSKVDNVPITTGSIYLVQGGNTILFQALNNIIQSAKATGGHDKALFYAAYPNAPGSLGSQVQFIKHILGEYVSAKVAGAPDAVCYCGYETTPVPANAPSLAPAAGK
ncbi:hypothetical protein WJX72_012083 [[Myrmecia] bisecta]|uniref:Uncharacterized protein n=1 Tax=[Myrmecia] bisecta TaxID=41462 RepID=A0AAW1R9H4_9CHLO